MYVLLNHILRKIDANYHDIVLEIVELTDRI